MTSTGQAMKTPKKRNEETQMANNYIIPAAERESVNGIQEVSLLTEAFTNRRIFIFGEIDEETVFSFTVQMLNLMEDEQAESILRTRKLLNGILAKHTGRKLSEINKATDHNNFMTATEAIEFGLCDKVVNSIL
mgnify:FL=1